MESNILKFKEELKKLIAQGELLKYSMALDLKVVEKETEKELKKLKLPSFKNEYEQWYSLAPDKGEIIDSIIDRDVNCLSIIA